MHKSKKEKTNLKINMKVAEKKMLISRIIYRLSHKLYKFQVFHTHIHTLMFEYIIIINL